MAYDVNFPADDEFLSAFTAKQREQIRAVVQDMIVNAGKLKGLDAGNAAGQIPISNGTENKGLNAEKLGGNLPSVFAAAVHGHSVATGSSNGFMSNIDKQKIDTIAQNAEVNQNAFSNVQVGTTTIQADSKTDTLEFTSGKNIAITPDATNDRVTIAVIGKIDNAASADTCTGNAATAANATNHISASSNAHAASAISCTATGDVTVTNVQAAIAELATEKVATSSISTLAVANKIVQRDSAGKIAGDITGNAASASLVAWGNVKDKPSTFIPPVASANTLGGIKVGSNLSVDANGVLSAAAQVNYDAGHSFAQNGWQELSNGLILQWGHSRDPNHVTFPIAFPNAVLCALATRSGTDGVARASACNNITLTGMTPLYGWSGDLGYWFTIGC